MSASLARDLGCQSALFRHWTSSRPERHACESVGVSAGRVCTSPPGLSTQSHRATWRSAAHNYFVEALAVRVDTRRRLWRRGRIGRPSRRWEAHLVQTSAHRSVGGRNHVGRQHAAHTGLAARSRFLPRPPSVFCVGCRRESAPPCAGRPAPVRVRLPTPPPEGVSLPARWSVPYRPWQAVT